jgi:hypothetical protein
VYSDSGGRLGWGALMRSEEGCRPAACVNESLKGLARLFGSILCSDDPTHLLSTS